MKFNPMSAVMGACFAFGLLGLNSFRAPRVDCLTEGQANVLALLSVVTTPDCSEGPGYTTLRITGANLQVVNGVDNETGNGLGNVLIGYGPFGETQCGTLTCSNDGSHNIVLGSNNSYQGWGSIVGGYSNIVAHDSIVFGECNTVSGSFNTVLSGSTNYVNGTHNAVLTGSYNSLDEDLNAVVGGDNNLSFGTNNVVVGGQYNQIQSGTYNVVDGGYGRQPYVDGAHDWGAGSLTEDN